MVRTHPDPPVFFIGGVAQLGERLLCKQEVIGSIPFTSTIFPRIQNQAMRFVLVFWPEAVAFFNNTEEVKVLISVPVSCISAASGRKSDNGFDCIWRST
jgi:hypothetical protein